MLRSLICLILGHKWERDFKLFPLSQYCRKFYTCKRCGAWLAEHKDQDAKATAAQKRARRGEGREYDN